MNTIFVPPLIHSGSELARESVRKFTKKGTVAYAKADASLMSVGHFRNTLGRLQRLAALPTTNPESAGLCALGAVGNLIRVTDSQ
ncbi:hypothetical protein [Pseudomonas silensiensis]|uniref:hypothetical protein n=1 Tax=Pseudomonas silensiensis TaxID=2991049 RepID=UPI003D1CFAB1